MRTKILILFTLSTLLIGCSRNHIAEIIPGQTTINEAIDLLGEPIKVKNSSFNQNDEMYHFESGTLQVEKKLVKVVFSVPKNEKEKNLQYWRQEMVNEQSVEQPLRAPSGLGQYEIKFPKSGVALIFDSNIEKVIKVIRYEPQK